MRSFAKIPELLLHFLSEEGYPRELTGGWKRFISIFLVATALYHVYIAAVGELNPRMHRVIHVLLFMFLVFIIYGPFKSQAKERISWQDIVNAFMAMAAGIYYLLNFERIDLRSPLADPLFNGDLFFGLVLIFLVLEGIRRTLGPPLVIVIVFFLLYLALGNHMPGWLYHRGLSLKELVDQLYLTLDGMYGIAIGVSSTYLIMFVIFGAFLEKSGGADFIYKLACSIAGGTTGGPAKVAVVSSGIFGTISGSPVANVVVDGWLTIPMMKKLGYPAAYAGAVEAVASTGGCMMPPVMGAVAFMMSELTGIPYYKICIAAAWPAILYYLSAGAMVHFEAKKRELKPMSREEIPPLIPTLKKGLSFLLPLGALVWALGKGYSPTLSAFYAILIVIVSSWLKKEGRMGIKEIWGAMELGAKGTIMIVSACAGIGMMISSIAVSGIGGKAISLLLSFGGGYEIMVFFFTMVAALILGMGMPVVPVYMFLAVLAAPAMLSLGVSAMAAHLFIVYYAAISAITPPVAVAAYAAAPFAGVSPMQVGWQACRIGVAGFIIPFMFLYNPSLMLQGPVLYIIQPMITSVIGILVLAVGVEGWFLVRAGFLERLLFSGGGILLIYPGLKTDLIGGASILLAAVIQFRKKRKSKVPVGKEG